MYCCRIKVVVIFIVHLFIRCATHAHSAEDVVCRSAQAERSERIYFDGGEGESLLPNNVTVFVPAEVEVGQQATIVVHGAGTRKPVDLYVWVHGPAMKYASNIRVGEFESHVPVLLFDQGLYEVFVEILAHGRNRKYKFWLPVLGSPFPLRVQTGPRPANNTTLQIDIHTNSCGAAKLSLPTGPCTGLSGKPGRWLRCVHLEAQFHDSACTTQGWTYVPEDCYYSKLGPAKLKEGNETSWVVFVGTSVLRGAFWAAVDAALEGSAGDFTKTSTWKCWGWINYKIGNLRISYRDFRLSHVSPTPSAEEMQYIRDTAASIEELGAEQFGGKLGPDVVVHEFWPVRADVSDAMPKHTVQDTLKWLGSKWDGELWLGLRLFFPFETSDTNHRYNYMLQTVATNLSGTDPRVHFYDVLEMSAAFIHHMQFGIKDRITQHHHKNCLNGETIGRRGALVCGPAAEMAGMLFLNTLLAVDRSHVVTDDNIVHPAPVAQVEVCESCPFALSPFSSPSMRSASCIVI